MVCSLLFAVFFGANHWLGVGYSLLVTFVIGMYVATLLEAIRLDGTPKAWFLVSTLIFVIVHWVALIICICSCVCAVLFAIVLFLTS